MKMNVGFVRGEVVNGFKIVSQNGLTQYVAENEDISIAFYTDAGAGRNYSKVLWYLDKRSGRTYRAMRYIYKYVSAVQGLSNVLYQRYINQ